jgi:16S rRNA (guanine527-N7)-methyltransferase
MRNNLEKLVETFELSNRINIDSCIFYLEEMLKWNKTHGLTAITQLDEVVIKHIGDSLSIYAFIEGDCFADVGSGAGLPGIPLALLFPDKHFTLIESQNKKAGFLRHIKRSLHLNNIDVIQQRVENYHPERLFDGILTRAFTSLPNMLLLTKHLCADTGYFLAMKGEVPQDELSAIMKDYPQCRIKPLFVPGLNAERHCIIIQKENAMQKGTPHD